MKRIVSIFGGSGSGKSTLAKALAEPGAGLEAARIPVDFYLKPREVPYEEFLHRPLQYDWDLLGEVLREPVGKTLTPPQYDFEEFRRISPCGGRPFTLRPLSLLDAMIPYPRSDVFIFIDTPPDVRRQRIAGRDLVWGTRVAARWEQLELTFAEGRRQCERVDLELDGLAPVEENVERVAGFLQRWQGWETREFNRMEG